MNKKNNRKGFTIVELVIVIAVIAILATVLIPTFGNLISDANETAAQQEARNEYTEYLIDHPTADVDYIFINNDTIFFIYCQMVRGIQIFSSYASTKKPLLIAFKYLSTFSCSMQGFPTS